MRLSFIVLLFAVFVSSVASAQNAKQQRQRCAQAKATELRLAYEENANTQRRRQLQEWAIRECGGLENYQLTRPAGQ